jgi:hypothetical protein
VQCHCRQCRRCSRDVESQTKPNIQPQYPEIIKGPN